MEKRRTAEARALAEGRMVAGFVPAVERPRAPAPARPSVVNGAQLWGWREFDRARAEERKAASAAKRHRWRLLWEGWKLALLGKPKAPRRESRVSRADRRLLLAEYGLPYSGRQWRRLRKGILRGVKASRVLAQRGAARTS